MEVSSNGRGEFQFPSKHDMKETEKSPERSKAASITQNRVAVVYYLSRNGHLEHPHFIEVPLPPDSTQGLYLRDVVNRLNVLRGKGMASIYSWSSKRSYKNGYVWHDLAENDFIYPTNGNEYVLKGSEMTDRSLSFRIQETGSSSSSSTGKLAEPHNINSIGREERRNHSWSSIDLHEYKVYKEPNESLLGKAVTAAAGHDACTQTDEKQRIRRRRALVVNEHVEEVVKSEEIEISPPPLSPSPENQNKESSSSSSSLICSDNISAKNHRSKASSVLMQLISCGSVSSSVNDENQRRLSMSSGGRTRKVEEEGSSRKQKGGGRFGGIGVEDKEYFSGSLIMDMALEIQETKDLPALKRSSSYNADRSSKFELGEREEREEGGAVRSKCIPRKSIRKEDVIVNDRQQ